MMQMGGRRNDRRIDAKPEQLVDVITSGAADDLREQRAVRRTRIGDADDVHARQVGEDTGMIAAHDSNADDAEPNRRVLRGTTHLSVHPRCRPRARLYHAAHRLATCPAASPEHVLNQPITGRIPHIRFRPRGGLPLP